MLFTGNKQIRIAILDLYEGAENQGMRCIREIINLWSEANNLDVLVEEFDVRQKLETPDLSYDIFISTGGPGSPLESEGSNWDNNYFKWFDAVEKWNNDITNTHKKYVFLICHSFQLVCRHYAVGKVCKRNSTSFGVFPVHMLQDGKDEIVFEGLNDPFYAVDSRDYQLIEPNHNLLREMGAKILSIEKNRPHVPYERAVMGIRFNDYVIGTQFHPEADAIGMSMYLQRDDKKKNVIENHGEAKWKSMVEQLQDPDKIMFTYNHILPNFLNQAVGELIEG
ncbi:glutamine amidotransferase [mine drainage metagenome]|uniref:Glutamine amidotransferase n=1 Tax=mine drainage metagenome TaxID=410659 RepID=A0A1J5SVZ5_9ZZZZ